jgi:hypothetical protein
MLDANGQRAPYRGLGRHLQPCATRRNEVMSHPISSGFGG